jgi:hypothetical protein
MQFFKTYFKKLLSLLRVRSRADGLEVSDQVLRLVYFGRNAWQMEAVRLAPGVVEKGEIKDAPAFGAALRELRSKVPAMKGKNKKLNVSIALSSVNMYSQVFTLPIMEGEDLDKAIDLNVQMISPLDISHSYFGWQLLGRDEASLRSEIAAAFADKAIVDGMIHAFYAAGFIAVGVESRALALVRTLREKGADVDGKGSYVLLDVDNSGIDFLIVRKGKLYFEYANPWTDIADEKGQISVTRFEEMLTANMRQVLNFYSQHWPEPLSGVILSATAFKEEAEQAIHTASSLPLIPLSLAMDQQIPPEWFVAFGCGLRGIREGLKDKEINLSGFGAMDAFHEEQMLDFLSLWRVLVPVALGCLIILFVLADNFLGMTITSIKSSAAFEAQGNESADVAALDASSTAFNRSVALVANAEGQVNRNYLMIAEINTTAAANGITISHISFQAANTPILVAGSAQSEDQIAAFQRAIQNDPHFGTVTLPLLNIQGNGGAYAFSMTFPLSSSGF